MIVYNKKNIAGLPIYSSIVDYILIRRRKYIVSNADYIFFADNVKYGIFK